MPKLLRRSAAAVVVGMSLTSAGIAQDAAPPPVAEPAAEVAAAPAPARAKRSFAEKMLVVTGTLAAGAAAFQGLSGLIRKKPAPPAAAAGPAAAIEGASPTDAPSPELPQ